MKKIYLIIALSASVYSAQYTKQDRILDMQKMAEAMSTIETGFFYNNKEIVKNGALDLSKIVKRVKPPLSKKERQDQMEDYVRRKIELSNEITNKISSKAITIYERFDTKDARSSIQAYTSIVKQCMKCHHQIRNW